MTKYNKCLKFSGQKWDKNPVSVDTINNITDNKPQTTDNSHGLKKLSVSQIDL